MKTRKRPTGAGALFSAARCGTEALAIRPSALSIFWLWGIGTPNENRGLTTIVTIDGPLEHHAGWWDGYDAVLERFKAACEEESTTTVVLRISSPGGHCAGLYEAHRMMLEIKASTGKRVVAYADESAYSAAYALACVADEIYLPRSGGLGSVGVIAACYDRVGANDKYGLNVAVVYAGARKADCHPDLPLSDEAIAGVKADVDHLAEMLHELVASSRGIDADAVAALEAATFMGDDAMGAGLADGVMGFDELLAMLADDTTNTDGETSTTKEDAMGRKAARVKASEVTALDPLAKPIVSHPSGAQLGAAVEKLESKSEESTEEETEEEETEEETEDKSDDEESAEESDEEDGDGEEEDDDDGEEAAESPAPMPAATRQMTSGDVLKAIREITGETSPGAQLGALRAMSESARGARKAQRQALKAGKAAARTELTSVVDKAIRMGKLTPGQRSWAIGAGIEVVRGYLKNAPAVVQKTGTKPKSMPKGTKSDGNGEITDAIASVAKAMQMDPSAIAAHAAELKQRGIIH